MERSVTPQRQAVPSHLSMAQTLPGVIAVAAALLCVVLPGGSSLWIDEAATARLAQKPSLHAWTEEMIQGKGSEHQMPLSMLLAWVSGHTIGTTEWALRAPNILWGVAAVLALFLAGQRMRLPWLPALLVMHPYFVSYMNEARPYALQIAAGSWLVYAMVTFEDEEGGSVRWALAMSLSTLVLCGSSLLGIIPTTTCALVMVWLGRRARYQVPVNSWMVAGITTLLLIPLGLFYCWTLCKHAGGARLWPVTFANVAFASYELAGFGGLGPGRIALREAATAGIGSSLATVYPHLLPFITLILAYVVLAVFAFGSERRYWPRPLILASAIVLIACAGLLGLAFLAGWPFWGRHLAPIFPFVVLVISFAAERAWRRKWSGKLGVLALVTMLSASSVMIRFSSAHQKDDYRSAAAVAKDAVRRGYIVWWLADKSAAHYYGLPLASKRVITRPNPESVLLVPDLVVLSKPDIYDRTGAIRVYLAKHSFRVTRLLPAFQIWRSPETREAKDRSAEKCHE